MEHHGILHLILSPAVPQTVSRRKSRMNPCMQQQVSDLYLWCPPAHTKELQRLPTLPSSQEISCNARRWVSKFVDVLSFPEKMPIAKQSARAFLKLFFPRYCLSEPSTSKAGSICAEHCLVLSVLPSAQGTFKLFQVSQIQRLPCFDHTPKTSTTHYPDLPKVY